MDWIVELPESGECTQIWVIMDQLTKMAYFIPLKTGVTTVELAQAFLRFIWKLHGLLDEIIMDRDTKITSLFWQKLIDLMGIISKMTTAFHPQSNGQTERINQIPEEYLLRHYCSWKQDVMVTLAVTRFALRSADYDYDDDDIDIECLRLM